ncbi:MAG: DNA polymerase III subunit delta' [Candidatus Omnitrophica bacterium]|nr:DNA polymerase III subunit delta' [Candidatus Omnitrophota bacterium]
MFSLNDIKGQNNAIRYLTNSILDGRVASSYLFSGPEGVGRSMTARAFIAALTCPDRADGHRPCLRCSACLRIHSDEHPDVKWIKPEKNKAVKIEQIRRAKDALHLKPFESGISVCVIEDAHLMTREASNALLKVLEEPPGKAMMILITHKKQKLLPTVISRCVELRFSFLPVETAAEIIRGSRGDIDAEKARFYAAMSQGSPGTAVRLIEDGVLDRREKVISFVERITGGEDPLSLNWPAAGRDDILEDIELIIALLRDAVLSKAGMPELAVGGGDSADRIDRIASLYSADRAYEVINELLEKKAAVTGNVNPRLIAQALPARIYP